MADYEICIKRYIIDDEEEAPSTGWKIALADKFCALSIVFLALFALAIDPDKKEGLADYYRPQVEDEYLTTLMTTYDELKEILEEEGVIVDLDESARSISVRMDSEMLFESGSADLRQGAVNVINSFVPQIADREFYWHVYGYTDNIGFRAGSRSAFRNNLMLSVGRAASAADAIINNGVPEYRTTIHGEGQLNNISHNATSEGRQNNRRVELYLTESSVPMRTYHTPE